jgi:hypothetical protein
MSDAADGTAATGGTGGSDDANGEYHLRDRADEPGWKLWLYDEADRWAVVGGLLAGVFLVLLAVGYGYSGAAAAVRSRPALSSLFQAMVVANITGVTLVLTLNQLVLSQELGAVGDQRERMEKSMSFREEVADVLDLPVSPARPARFLRAFVQVAADRARSFRGAVDGADPELVSTVDEYFDQVTAEYDRVDAELEGGQFGTFDVVSAALDLDYSRQLFAAKRIGATHDLSGRAAAALDELVAVLELYAPAREHFKTLYFQWALIVLSRTILWAALPALLVAASMIAFFDPTAVTLRAAGVDLVPGVVAAATAVALLPFLVLVAYVLRIATVTRYTLAVGPFLLRSADRVESLEEHDREP